LITPTGKKERIKNPGPDKKSREVRRNRERGSPYKKRGKERDALKILPGTQDKLTKKEV